MKNKKFVLTRRNQKGQVAIFVALIFQVIFVFFAVLINVGLLVHHKINLQQSTDLAAYYGAMKQAEILNAISHVNFQMRQAWKLLTWRYRVLGTFGFQDNDGVGIDKLHFPLDISLNPPTVTRFGSNDAEIIKCPVTNVNILDVPFFCVAHGGMKGWKNANENSCRINCKQINGNPNIIPVIPPTGGYDITHGVVAAVNAALDKANSNIQGICSETGPISFNLLAKHIVAYGAEVQQKKKLIQMLASDLSKNETSIDLDGGLIKDGSRKTFEHNLTEANLTGRLSFDTFNGLASQGNECAFEGTPTDGDGNKGQFLTEIKFKAIQFFVHQCTGAKIADKLFQPASIYADATFQTLANSFIGKLPIAVQADITKAIVQAEYIIGYEKNPWCHVYYGTKAQAEPKIPFLPLGKIKLSAISFAKPFGGTIGPRYNSIWSAGPGVHSSDSGQKVDPTLPLKSAAAIPPNPSELVMAESILLNFSNFVGDQKGLRSAETVATYQDILLHRQLQTQLSGSEPISIGKDGTGQKPNNVMLGFATVWPSFENWNNLGDPANTAYDYLATEPGDRNSYMRDLEIAVIAPNQFDLNYFSIDPDFFNNYYLKITNSFNKIKTAAGIGPASIDEVKPDYGNNLSLQKNGSIAKSYSVRHQMAVAANVIKVASHKADQFPTANVAAALNFIPDKTASLLTGWTFETFSDYNKFPDVGPNPEFTMTFGKCADPWNFTTENDLDKNYGNPVSKNLPATPGNCVTGGRTGYSVKLISPSLVRVGGAPQPYGGAGTSGVINNPADESFFTF